MKLFFEFDTDSGVSRDEKLKELREIEKLILEEAKKDVFAKHEKWLRSLPEKPF